MQHVGLCAVQGSFKRIYATVSLFSAIFVKYVESFKTKTT